MDPGPYRVQAKAQQFCELLQHFVSRNSCKDRSYDTEIVIERLSWYCKTPFNEYSSHGPGFRACVSSSPSKEDCGEWCWSAVMQPYGIQNKKICATIEKEKHQQQPDDTKKAGNRCQIAPTRLAKGANSAPKQHKNQKANLLLILTDTVTKK